MNRFAVAIFALLAISCFTLDPPLWPERFSQSFVQGDQATQFYTSGKLWYDVANNRQRSEVQSDHFDLLCMTVSKTQNSTCNQVIMNDNLYIWLPEENQCCKCCTAAEGCKITERDWLKEYQYVGIKSISWDFFNAWTHYDLPVNTTYYATLSDNNIPRRMSYGSYGIDFMMNTYTEDPIPDSVFNLPSSCEKDCPKTSFCANFRPGKETHKYKNFFTAPKRLVQKALKIRSEQLE